MDILGLNTQSESDSSTMIGGFKVMSEFSVTSQTLFLPEFHQTLISRIIGYIDWLN